MFLVFIRLTFILFRWYIYKDKRYGVSERKQRRSSCKAQCDERIFYAEDIAPLCKLGGWFKEKVRLEALIVSGSKAEFDSVCGVVKRAGNCNVTYVGSGAGALNIAAKNGYDLIVVGAVADMPRERAAKELSAIASVGVIMLFEGDAFEKTARKAAEYGIVVVPANGDAENLFSAVVLLNAVNARMENVRNQNEGLKKKLDDVKVIDRAKMILMQTLGYDEQQAHRHIERQAMELRLGRREIAMNILKTYEV